MRRGTFIVLVASLLTVSLITMLLLNTVLSQGSFRRYELLTKTGDLDTGSWHWGRGVQTRIAGRAWRRAREQGMVPNQNPAFIDLQTGRVLGEGIPARSRLSPRARRRRPTEPTAGPRPAETAPRRGPQPARMGCDQHRGYRRRPRHPDNPLGVGSGPDREHLVLSRAAPVHRKHTGDKRWCGSAECSRG